MNELTALLADPSAEPTVEVIYDPVSAILLAESSALAVLPKPIIEATDEAEEANPPADEAISAPIYVALAAVSRPAAVDPTAVEAGDGVEGLGLVKGDISLPIKLLGFSGGGGGVGAGAGAGVGAGSGGGGPLTAGAGAIGGGNAGPGVVKDG